MLGFERARREREVDFVRRQRPDVRGDEQIAEIALRIEVAGRRAFDRRMARQIDGVGDQRRSGVGDGGRGGEHRHRVGDAEREAAAAPARGRDAAHAVARPDGGAAEHVG